MSECKHKTKSIYRDGAEAWIERCDCGEYIFHFFPVGSDKAYSLTAKQLAKVASSD